MLQTEFNLPKSSILNVLLHIKEIYLRIEFKQSAKCEMFRAITVALIACFSYRLERIVLNYTEHTSVHCLGYLLTVNQTNNSNFFTNFLGAAVYRISWAGSFQQTHNNTDIRGKEKKSYIFLSSILHKNQDVVGEGDSLSKSARYFTQPARDYLINKLIRAD